mgnify:CR=1 FL=1
MADDSKRLVELNTQLADLADKSSQLEKEDGGAGYRHNPTSQL